MEYLIGNTTMDTAYLVTDYPYGFKLRCQIRYWLEYHQIKGFRFCSQTTDPRKGFIYWNKPKMSTYVKGVACMTKADNGHISWESASYAYSGVDVLEQWYTRRDILSTHVQEELEHFIRIKREYNRLKADGVDYHLAAVQAIASVQKGAL